VPPATAVDLLAVNKDWIPGLANSFSEHRDAIGVGRVASTHGAHVLVPERWLIPIIEWNAHIDRTRRRLNGHRIRSHERAWNILRPERLIGPLHPRAWKDRLIDIRQ